LLGFVIASDPNLLKPVTRMEGYYENSQDGKVLELDVTGDGNTSRITDPFRTDLCDQFWPFIWSQYNALGEHIGQYQANAELK
jgi:hypothetical protein